MGLALGWRSNTSFPTPAVLSPPLPPPPCPLAPAPSAVSSSFIHCPCSPSTKALSPISPHTHPPSPPPSPLPPLGTHQLECMADVLLSRRVRHRICDFDPLLLGSVFLRPVRGAPILCALVPRPTLCESRAVLGRMAWPRSGKAPRAAKVRPVGKALEYDRRLPTPRARHLVQTAIPTEVEIGERRARPIGQEHVRHDLAPLHRLVRKQSQPENHRRVFGHDVSTRGVCPCPLKYAAQGTRAPGDGSQGRVA